MIADAERGEFRAILAWDQDRFGRFDSIEAGHWIHPLRQAGVCLVTPQGVIDWSDFAGRLVYGVTQEAKHQYLRDLSRNMLRSRITSAKRGEWLSPAPLGYVSVNKRLEFGDRGEIALVRRMFREYLAGRSLRAIAIQLNAEGLPTSRGNA
jgi:DNA invertase Pin-like site-specific DNA recombinase